MGFAWNDATMNDETTVYSDWLTNYKVQTGDQNWNISNIDVVAMYLNYYQNVNDVDADEVDWTKLSITGAGCESPPSADIVINAQPATPSAPVAGTITQPT